MTPDAPRPPIDDDPAPDVRAMLHRHSEAVTPRGTYADIERRIAEAGPTRHRSRPQLAVAAAVLLVVLVGGMFALAERGTDGDGRGVRVNTAGPGEPLATEPGPDTDPTATDPSPEPSPGDVTTTAPDDAVEPSATSATTVATVPATTTTDEPLDPSAIPPYNPPRGITPESSLRITGIGPISVPMAVADASAATGQDLRVDPGSRLGESNPCGFAQIDGLDELWFMVDGDRLVRVDVTGSTSWRTSAGVGVGSSEAEVRDAYPGLVTTEAHPYPMDDDSRYLVVTDPAHPGYEIIFSVHRGAVLDYRVGLAEFVRYPEGCA